mmetsp:Transcript_12394/g.14729  ORF Transcript_12394/g.14729 Transcript_12394/m.14729 type:complete len:82 (-) Transcript_12394:296-541(-)
MERLRIIRLDLSVFNFLLRIGAALSERDNLHEVFERNEAILVTVRKFNHSLCLFTGQLDVRHFAHEVLELLDRDMVISLLI